MRHPEPFSTRLSLLLLTVATLVPFPAAGGEFSLNGRTFRVPDGFIIERIAGPPLVDRPITADFDEQGRLYVADSSGSNDPPAKQLIEKPHRILRLEDTDGDGTFDRRTVFADKMMFPEGTMWLDGSLYVAAPPSIWKLTDNDGDGVADTRVEWFQGKTLTGCANDLHGPYRGPDGWIYWCKGAFAEQTYESPGKAPFVTKAAHIFRSRPDGLRIEPVMTGGMDNPVDVVFTPGGERIFTTTFLQHPGGGKRDGLIHAIHGGIYGKIHDPIFAPAHKWTAPEVMPVMTHLGPAAPAGLHRLESSGLGTEFKDNIFACCFNLHKITRHVLKPEGATFTTADEDFVVAPDLDFHPTDVIEDADGSLLVLDTGGWYKLCCPTSQLPKPDVLGAIYRVRKANARKVEDARGLKLDWNAPGASDLAKRLDDQRPAVRKRAIAALAALGAKALPALSEMLKAGEISGGGKSVAIESRGADARIDAVWTACRIDHSEARKLGRLALSDPNPIVRQAAAHSASLWRDQEAVHPLTAMLNSQEAANRRVAAEALGRIGDPSAVSALLEAIATAPDRTLEHSLTFALIDINNPKAVRDVEKTLTSDRARLAAIVTLDQMEAGRLTVDQVASWLTSTSTRGREVASWIAGRHPEWAGDLASFFRSRLGQANLAEADRAELAGQLTKFAASVPVRDLLAETLQNEKAPREIRIIALRVMAQSGLKTAPSGWVEAIREVLGTKDISLLREAVATVRALPIPKGEASDEITGKLLSLARAETLPEDLRLDAMAAAPSGMNRVDERLFALLLKQIEAESSVSRRTAAATVISKAKLLDAQLLALAGAIKTASPLEIDRLLTAFETTKDDTIGLRLVESLRQSSAIGSLRVDMLKPRLDRFGDEVKSRSEALYATLNVDAAKQKARLEALLPQLAGGDIRRGQVVFHSSKAACMTCHAVGYVGGVVGPDLTSIGKIRAERDLLEAIVYPSLSIVRSYEPLTIATKSGKVVNGLLKRESSDELVLVTGVNQEERVARGDVEEMRPGTVSIMPAGLDQQLTRQELADLLAFLKSRK